MGIALFCSAFLYSLNAAISRMIFGGVIFASTTGQWRGVKFEVLVMDRIMALSWTSIIEVRTVKAHTGAQYSDVEKTWVTEAVRCKLLYFKIWLSWTVKFDTLLHKHSQIWYISSYSYIIRRKNTTGCVDIEKQKTKYGKK